MSNIYEKTQLSIIHLVYFENNLVVNLHKSLVLI